MRFHAYPRIGANAGSAGGPWVATEKVHGANFVVGVAGDDVRFGKRKAWLARDAAFFGWQLIAAELEERVRAVARAVGAVHVVCYGELFGGGYPHPDVAEVPGLAPVQTGIWYAPDLRWALFDLLVATTTASCSRSPTSRSSPLRPAYSCRRSSAAAGATISTGFPSRPRPPCPLASACRRSPTTVARAW